MASFTLLQLRTQIRQRADIERSQHITDAEINGYINASIRELRDLLIQKFGEDYFVSNSTITTTSGDDTYDLPADFFKLLGVDLQVASGEFITLKPFMFSERNRYNTNILRGVYGSQFTKYRIQGSSIVFRPIPETTNTIKIFYIPMFTSLSSDSDTWDGFNGWEEYVVIDGTIKCKAKEESDVNIEAAQKAALIKRIEEVAGNRDAGLSFRVSDVRGIDAEQSLGFYDI